MAAADVICPRCGTANRPGAAFCVNCGNSLAAGSGPSPGPAGMPPGVGMPSAYPTIPPFADPARQQRINRTRTGVVLLLVGTLLSNVPVIGLLGALLIFVGAILVILGRHAFGPAHARNVLLSILVFILGLIIAFVGGFIAGAVVLSGLFGGPVPTQAAARSAMDNFLILVVIGSIVGGLASVFFTFAVQKQIGRILLLAGYAASVAIWIAIFLVLSPEIPQTVASMFPGGVYNGNAALNAFTSVQVRIGNLGLLNAIPSVLYAAAYYLVWTRINKGEIPSPTTPGMPPPIMPPIAPR